MLGLRPSALMTASYCPDGHELVDLSDATTAASESAMPLMTLLREANVEGRISTAAWL
jgi:hypothetical protein